MGIKELKKSNWLNAQAYFLHVHKNFGFSKWATLSELGLADAQFGRTSTPRPSTATRASSRPTRATSACRTATRRSASGYAYFKEIPSDFFVMPPSYEKDQGPVIDALRELSAFADQYGDSPYAAEARKLIGECVRKLTDHELYVARFYLDANKPYAAIGRLEGIIKEYPASQREPEIMLLLGKTYLKMEKPTEARARSRSWRRSTPRISGRRRRSCIFSSSTSATPGSRK